MKWTKTPPDKPGYYWFKDDVENTPMVVQVYGWKDEIWQTYYPDWADKCPSDLAEWNPSWSDEPIVLPEGD